MPETTTPGTVADAVTAALTAQGGRVVQRVADHHWSNGFVVIEMPDGTAVRVSIDLD
jgi:hypothetical protein